MEEIKIAEQDIINAICLHIASKKAIRPEQIEVELMYDDQYGFSAEVYTEGRKQVLVQSNMIEALRFWLDTELNIDPFATGLELVLDDAEGIIAYGR